MKKAKYSQHIKGPDLKISMNNTVGHLTIGSLLCLPNAKIIPINNPKTQPALATIKITKNFM